MGFLTVPIDDTVKYGKYLFRVNTAFDIVLDIQRLYKEDLEDYIKIEQALSMLVKNPGKLKRMGIQDKAGLLEAIYSECITSKQRAPVREKIPLLDFEEDGEYIFSSFMLDYGIDLIRMQGKLQWKKFIALFQGLSEKSKIREVMRIRSMEIPQYNGKNQKQIQEIQELKSYYALPVRGGGGQKGLDALFSVLEAQAVKQ